MTKKSYRLSAVSCQLGLALGLAACQGGGLSQEQLDQVRVGVGVTCAAVNIAAATTATVLDDYEDSAEAKHKLGQVNAGAQVGCAGVQAIIGVIPPTAIATPAVAPGTAPK